MANSPGVCVSFKVDQLNAIHAFGTTVARAGTGADTFKMALYLQTASLSPTATSAYTATGEITGSNYSAGGNAVGAFVAPTSSGTSAFTTPVANVVFNNLTQTVLFDTALLYNATQANKAVAIYQFTAQTIISGTFTLTMPANAAGTALLQAN